ncbi:unnamed protein product [Trypanosoma congolense IL3000]|uniref:WGS project CAEQ00000000 data, annotated contig 2063 n=1 Tax=Trypanosoma congolense (strain IL3000) TaxID=1068625 RepID=F9WB55_TRYCI|nr:unnamed protein product [Trypanosoma congolense IL3000]
MIFMVKASSVCLIVVGSFMVLYPVPCACSYYPKALLTDAGVAICSLSRKLKDVAPWTAGKLTELKKTRDEYASKLLNWNLHFHGFPDCGGNESLFEEVRTALGTVNKELGTLPRKSIRAGALAAKSAGRLDEFMTVFAGAHGGGQTFLEKARYCFGYKGSPATRTDFHDCFPTGSRFEIGEANLAKIPESAADRDEPNFASVIENITQCSRRTRTDMH